MRHQRSIRRIRCINRINFPLLSESKFFGKDFLQISLDRLISEKSRLRFYEQSLLKQGQRETTYFFGFCNCSIPLYPFSKRFVNALVPILAGSLFSLASSAYFWFLRTASLRRDGGKGGRSIGGHVADFHLVCAQRTRCQRKAGGLI